ncbi:hypothetical protein ACFYY1_38665 [Streptomyces sp. NPDC001890]|uniref:hypothetical protein n=1 Tax=Streptomyces sp. NPDC001890 TaxID=3364620 RepID=UPI0036836E60
MKFAVIGGTGPIGSQVGKKLNAAGHAAVPPEFVAAALSWTTEGDVVRPPIAPIQPIAAQDVPVAVAEVAACTP